MTLKQQLQMLEGANLIRLAETRQELAYLFRHALVHEAAYASLVRADRQRLHAMVGECLERLVAGEPATLEAAAALTRHFDQAEDARALKYAVAAAEAAAGRYANAEAVAHYDLVLKWAQSDTTTTGPQLAAWHQARGRALELSGQFQAALDNYRALSELGTKRGDEGLTLKALVLEGTLRATVNPLFDIPEAERLATAGLALARARGDRAAEARIYWNRLNQLRFSGRFEEARISGEASLRLARESGEPEQLALTLNDLAHVYGMSGAWPEHRAAADEAAQRWRALDNLPMLADSLSTAALYASFRGDYATARRTATEAGQIARAIGNVWGQAYSLSGLAYVLLQRAEYAECLRISADCLRLAEEAGYMAPPIMNRVVLADALSDLGQPEAALQEARTALAFADRHVFRLRDIAVGMVALQLLANGAPAEAEAMAQSVDLDSMGETVWASEPIRRVKVEAALAVRSPLALQLAEARLAPMRRQSMPPYVAEALEALARAQRQAGQPEAARASLMEARALCEQLGARRTLWRVLLGLAALATNPSEATALAAAGQGVVAAIADELPDHVWRAGFLQRVRKWEQATQ